MERTAALDISDPSANGQPPKATIVRNRTGRAARAASVEGRTARAASRASAALAGEYKSDGWVFTEMPGISFDGASRFASMGKKEEVVAPIAEGIERFRAEPATYLALMYQTGMTTWPAEQQRYTLLHRQGTKGWRPEGVSSEGWMTVLIATYQALPPLADLGAACDAHTDGMAYEGRTLHAANAPYRPGRGDGVGDMPGLKIIGDVDPSDIKQGSVGDCWLLGAISALAEFDGAVHALFRKTPNLSSKPAPTPNTYTLTLWDLPIMKEVDVIVDERLARRADGGGLLGAAPSSDAELWVCYLEKALAVHCGGWDGIEGGACTHAWAMLTGCREQCTIKRDGSGKFKCLGTFNPNDQRWEELTNSPHGGFQSLWPMKWPEVGGGGAVGLTIEEEELFMKLCAWDDANYIMAAGTKAGSDQQKTDGLVDGHAYSLLECVNDVAGTDVDLIKMRNPWGKGGEVLNLT